MLSFGQLILLAIMCPDGATGLPQAEDRLSEVTLGHSHVKRAAGQHVLPSAEVGSAGGRVFVFVVLGFKALPARCPPAIAAVDINFSQISASL